MDRDKIQMLATYHAEEARGIVHTALWRERMAELKAQYDRERQTKFAAVANG